MGLNFGSLWFPSRKKSFPVFTVACISQGQAAAPQDLSSPDRPTAMGNKKSFPAHFPYPTAPVGNKVKAPDAQSSRSSNPRADKKVARNSKQKKPESRLETSLQDPKLPQLLAAIQIEDMPEEILFHLLGFLFDTNDALLPSPIAAMLVCSKWRRLINGNLKIVAFKLALLIPAPLLNTRTANVSGCVTMAT